MKYQRIVRKIQLRRTTSWRRKLFISLIIASLSGPLSGQQIQLIEGTRQNWSGGICCRQGSNYTLTFKIIIDNHEVLLDTLWTECFCHPITTQFDPTLHPKESTLKISKSIIFDDHRSNDYEHELPCYDFSRSGTFLVYRINRVRHVLDLTDKIKDLVPLAYP